MRANCHWKMKHLHLAIWDFRKVLEFDPNNRGDRLALSRVLFDAGKYTEAIEGENNIFISHASTVSCLGILFRF